MPASTKPRVRFAPSPTGYLHVGGARTALFNWLFAKHEGGTLILRVEDTDVERNKPELVDGILVALKWLGVIGMRVRSFSRSAEKCIAPQRKRSLPAEQVTPVTASPPRMPAETIPRRKTKWKMRATRKGRKPRKLAACPCRDMNADQLAAKEKEGLPRAIRFKTPRTGTTTFEDAVFGPREVQNADIEDFVLLRSSGVPTYQLSVVVDDIDMRISHIIRGADHLSNTPKQVLIYHALGATPPIFAHVPLILGADRTRLSKRHGATSVGSYADEGFLPEAFRNFLALLGWSTGDDSEYMRTPELIERFSLSGVSRTNAIFDRAKLEWYNTQYLQKPPVEEIVPFVEAELKKAGLWQEVWGTTNQAWFARTVDLIRPRTRLLGDFTTWARAFFTDDFSYDVEAREKFWKDEKIAGMLGKLADALEALPDWNHDACDAASRAVAAAEGVKAGVLINATRVAIVGRAVAPPLFDTMVALSKDRVVARLRRAVEFLSAR